MAERRILYLTALIAALVFYWAYREWLSWVILVLTVLLPWLSLALSLRAMFSMEIRILCPERAGLGQEPQISLMSFCSQPHPPVRSRIRLTNAMTGQVLTLHSADTLPTDHCGAWQLQAWKPKVYDYLGLFSRRIRHCQNSLTYVMPAALPVTPAPDLTKYLATAFRPKPGGGYAENHELRLYRPGDNLHQIHWKLTAKTGKLILREPMDPIKGKAVVSLELSGSQAVVDKKLGTALWVSRYLLEASVPHELHCLTGDGAKVFPISHAQGLDKAILSLLKQPLAPAEARLDFIAASWKYHIGGDGYES